MGYYLKADFASCEDCKYLKSNGQGTRYCGKGGSTWWQSTSIDTPGADINCKEFQNLKETEEKE